MVSSIIKIHSGEGEEFVVDPSCFRQDEVKDREEVSPPVVEQVPRSPQVGSLRGVENRRRGRCSRPA